MDYVDILYACNVAGLEDVDNDKAAVLIERAQDISNCILGFQLDHNSPDTFAYLNPPIELQNLCFNSEPEVCNIRSSANAVKKDIVQC